MVSVGVASGVSRRDYVVPNRIVGSNPDIAKTLFRYLDIFQVAVLQFPNTYIYGGKGGNGPHYPLRHEMRR